MIKIYRPLRILRDLAEPHLPNEQSNGDHATHLCGKGMVGPWGKWELAPHSLIAPVLAGVVSHTKKVTRVVTGYDH